MSKPKPILVYPLYSPNVATDVDLATEVSNRQVGDQSLATAISTETSSRISADSSLASAIGSGGAVSTETSQRISADSSLTTALSSEISTRSSNVSSLASSINTKLSLSGGTMTGTLIGTQLNLSGKMYLSGLTTSDNSTILGYNSTTKEITITSAGNLYVSYAGTAGTSNNLYDGTGDTNVYAENTAPSEVWLLSDVGYNVCVNYATNAYNTSTLAGNAQSFYNTSYSTTTTGSTTNLDCSASINRILTISANAITIALTNYTNGQRGTVMLNLTNTGTTSITISNTPTAYKNGTYTGLTSGKYLLEWWTDYTNYAFWRIAKYT